MKRGKPLERRTRLRSRRASPRRSSRVLDAAYRAWVRRQPCCARSLPGHRCDGPIEGDHAGRRGRGQKADDATMIALCQLAHQQRDAFHGPFRTFDHDSMRSWLDDQVAAHQERYARRAA